MREGNFRNHIGPYQRPAPPKKPLGLNGPRAIQKPPVPMHEIQAQEQRLLEDIKANGNVLGLEAKVRKPGRPSVYEEPMTPAERQARRRAFRAQERGIQDALRINDGEGKSRLEAASGGYGSRELDILAAGLGANEEGTMTAGYHRANPAPAADDDKPHAVQVRGLQFGDEESNRRRFAEDELKKMVGEYFASSEIVKKPSAHWVARHVSNVAVQQQCSPSLTLNCRTCGDVMESIIDATDHLRVDHRDLISKWYARLDPPREFRDMGTFVTVVIPRKHKKLSESDD